MGSNSLKEWPVCLADFEDYARRSMAPLSYEYYSHGSDDDVTLRENVESFKRILIVPRVLRNVSLRSTQTTILGHSISFPVCIAPTALNGLAHPDGEVGTARGAMSMNIGHTLSSFSTRSIDEVADAAPDLLRFLQLHIFTSRGLVLRLVRWAERRDFKAIVLTVDTPILGYRVAWKRIQKLVIPLISRGTLDKALAEGNEKQYNFDPVVTWDDVKWLKSHTKLPLILKGILSAKDVDLALESGAAAILVSTHGGRQLDTIPASIDVLPEIVKAVNGRCEVYLDGGIRHGTDILKALALGARAVFVGRPAIYALAYKGEEGVRQMLEILKEEFSAAMALSGCANVEEIAETVTVINRQPLQRSNPSRL